MNSNKGQLRAVEFVILLGFVSLFSDMTYEGARSLTAQYLADLGATAIVVGFVGGLSEILGSIIRLLCGYVVDKTKMYWLFMFIGYFFNLAAVPLLAFVTSWQVASILIVLERLGKGIRTPPRDTLLSFSSKNIGRGWAFGLHELLDQIGAILGPLLVFTIFYFGGKYKESFLVMIIPALCALSILFITKKLYPYPAELEMDRRAPVQNKKLPSFFWFYIIFISLVLFGLIPFQLCAYYFKTKHIFDEKYIPLLFAFAMSVDAIVAPIVGKLYDRYKTNVLMLIPFFSLPIVLCILSGNSALAICGILFWGITVAFEESVMRAYIADIVIPEKRAFSYGIFNTITGLIKFIRTILMGWLIDKNMILLLVICSITFQIIACIIFVKFIKKHSSEE
ncbi:MAG: MFS transporter [Planctomycetota bacterium]